MSVPSLEDIAFFTTIKYIWNHSELLPLTIQQVHTALQKGTYLYYDDDVNKKIQEITELITEKMMVDTCLPLRFRVRWVVAFQDILTKLYKCGFDLAVHLDLNRSLITEEHIGYCFERIVQDQVGQIDKAKTVLKILEDSKFDTQFHKSEEFMAKYLVEVKELKIITENVLKEMEQKERQKVWHLRQGFVSNYSRKIDEWLANIFSSYTLGELVAMNELGKVYFYVEQQRRLSPDSLQEQLLKAADYLLAWARQKLSEDTLMFLYENMEPGTWTRLLEKHFVNVFWFMMEHSWRHRRLCVRWFTSVQHTLDSVSFRKIFLLLFRKLLFWKNWKYDYYEVMEILQSVWFSSLDHLKTDDKFIFSIIPRMFSLNYDVNVLAFFLNCYGPKQQRELLCQIVIHLLEKNKEDIIPKCLEIVPALELNQHNYKTIFNADFLKKHLVQDWSLSWDNVNRDHNGYLELLSSTLGDFQNSNKFKQELLKDKHFMIRYLSTHCYGGYIYHFLLWCHNGNTELLEAYKSQLPSESVIEKVYESILMKLGNISIADNVLINLKFTNGEDIVIKENILNKSKIKRCVLHTALKKCFSLKKFQDDLAFYFKEEDGQQAMEKLFLCDEGRDAILQMLMPTDFEKYSDVEHLKERRPVKNLLVHILRMKNSLLQPFSLEDTVESMLSEYGHPNRRELQIEYHRALSEREMAVARKLVDFNYRCARAILRRNFREGELLYIIDTFARSNDTHTDFSLSLAAQALLDIPVVL